MSFYVLRNIWLCLVKNGGSGQPHLWTWKVSTRCLFCPLLSCLKISQKTFGHSGLSVAVFTSDVAYFTFKGQQNCRFSENFQSKKLFWCWIILFQNNSWFDILFLKHDWSKVFRYNIKYWPKNPQSRVANYKKTSLGLIYIYFKKLEKEILIKFDITNLYKKKIGAFYILFRILYKMPYYLNIE